MSILCHYDAIQSLVGQEVGVEQRACMWEEADHMHLGMVGVVG